MHLHAYISALSTLWSDQNLGGGTALVQCIASKETTASNENNDKISLLIEYFTEWLEMSPTFMIYGLSP